MSRIRTVRLRGLELGGSRPVVIGALTAPDAAGLRAAVAGLPRAVDLVEWRVDRLAALRDMDPIDDVDRAAEAVDRELRALRGALGERPLLVTVRTAAEGGAWDLDDDAYEHVVDSLLAAGAADAVDVESTRAPALARRLVDAAHERGTAVVASHHDMRATPRRERIVEVLRGQQAIGADVTKIAVTPRDPGDVLTLLGAAWEMRSTHADRPLIAISMGSLGAVSRVAGHVFGSAASFASVGEASAPGQLSATELAGIIRALSS